MTDITEAAVSTKTGALSTLRLAELQQLATSMGIAVNSKMRKADLVSAIREQRGGSAGASAAPAKNGRADAASTKTAPTKTAPAKTEPAQTEPTKTDSSRSGSAQSEATPDTTTADAAPKTERAPQRRQATTPETEAPQSRTSEQTESGDASADSSNAASTLEAALDQAQAQREGASRNRRSRRGGSAAGAPRPAAERSESTEGGRQAQGSDSGTQPTARQSEQEPQREQRQQGQSQGGQQESRQGQQGGQQNRQQNYQGDQDDDGFGRGRRRSRQRSRGRGRGRGGQPQQEHEESYSEEDVLVPVAGVLDLLDSYAFIRTTGYLPGPTDIYVPMGTVRRHGLRKGDAVTGAIKAPQDGDDHQHTVSSTGNKRDRGKFSALVRLDSVNGQDPEKARRRPDFNSLTPLYPQERLRMETEQKNLTTRVIDLVSPIGKGQRGLLVSPPKAGKTMMLQQIANAITANNPEVHLMIVLVDERPEEVTDFQRSVKGEVIASTFDRPASDHTVVAELAIERAKRLVELGQDVVVLLDGITRLGRAYNLAAPASGRILSGGVDSSALYPPKKFFGAARNIENGGSLTILATALVETGSKMDEVIFEEFKGTGNWELKLSRQLSERRTFPAVDVNASGTRREEILMSGEELKIMWKLRRVLSALDTQQGIELLLDRLRKTRNNFEFLTQVQQTSSVRLDDED